ncbi:MAG: pitrilysin family protein [Pseudomonadota bacterium]|nr:pitrilysin family protein [Pseudomonadota bacterium]
MSVQVSVLENGMRVVTESMLRVETVSCGVWVGSGARNEPAEVNGVAHLLEHMAFKGTERRSAQDIVEEIESVGGHLNAYTSREQTAYYAKVLRENTELALDLLADILQHSIFDEEELERERAVVIQEIGQAHDTPDDRVFDHFQLAAFPNQPLGRPVLGGSDTVGTMPRERIMQHMQSGYGGDRMVLAAAGNVDHESFVAHARRLFDSVPANGNVVMEPGQYSGGAHLEDRDLEQVHLLLGFPGLSYEDDEFYATTVMSTLFGGGMSSRLFQEIREKRGLVYSIYCYPSFYRDCGLFGIYAGTGPDDIDELIPAICEEIKRLPTTLTDREIARARTQLKAATMMSLESTGARCEQLGQQMLIFGRPLTLEEQVGKIESVGEEAVRRIAERIFTGKPTIAAVGPVNQIMSYDELVAALAI